MKRANLVIRYFGLFVFLVGVILNIKMYIFDEWPTCLFFLLCLLGVFFIGISYLKLKKHNSIKS